MGDAFFPAGGVGDVRIPARRRLVESGGLRDLHARRDVFQRTGHVSRDRRRRHGETGVSRTEARADLPALSVAERGRDGAVIVAALWVVGTWGPLASLHIWDDSRFIGHAYTLSRVFWEFAWRSVIPVALSSDHQITETLVPPGSPFWNIPDKAAMGGGGGISRARRRQRGASLAQIDAALRRLFVHLRGDDSVPGALRDPGIHAGIPDLSGPAVVLPRRGHPAGGGVEVDLRNPLAACPGG